ncbi:hypothetical protein KR054_012215 [Drosophila jambulina]|nr:hypothetical protein KR054_012215 [Drosophila jambulina]
MEDIEYLDEYKDLVLPGIKNSDVRQSGGARRRRISSDSSNSSSLDADIFQKLFLDKSVDDDLLNLTEGAVSKSQSRRHRSPSSSDDSNDALDALFNRKLKTKPNKRRERFSSFDSVDDLGQALMRSTKRMTVPKPSTSQARAKKPHSDALYRSSSSSNSSARGKSTSRVSRPAVASSSGKSAAAAAAPSVIGKYRNPSKPSSVNGSSNAAGKGKAVTILKAQKTDLRPAKHEPKTDPLDLIEFFEDTDSDSSYSYESDFFDDNDSADEDVEPVIDISTDTSRTTSVADTVTPVVSDDDGQAPQREQDEQNKQNERNEESELNGQNEGSETSIMNSVYERLQSYLNNLSCAEAPPIYKKQSFAKKSRSSEKKPSSTEQVKHSKERSPASGKVQEEKERDQDREPTKFSGSSPSSPAKSAAHSTKSFEDKSSASASASRRLFDVDDDITLETLHRMTQDLAEQILEIDVERSVEYQKRSGSKHRSRSRSKGTASDLPASHVRKLTYSSERLNSSEHLDNGSEPLGTQLRRSKSESAFPKRGPSQGKKERKTRAATTEDNVLSSAKEPEGEVQEPEPVKRKRGRPRKKHLKRNKNVKSTESVQEPVAKDQEVSVETSGVEAVKEEEPEERELNSELEKAKDFAGFASQDDISMTSCHQETDLKSAPDEDAARNPKKEPQPTVDTSTESFDTAMDTSEITESVTRHKECLAEPEETQEDHPTDATIKDLEEIENAIETAGEIAMTPELADALDASTDVQATQVAGNILEESDSQLAEDIKLAEEILAAEVGKGIEVTEAAEATEVRDQDPVIDIVKELEQETITEVMGNSEESSSAEGQTEVTEKSPNIEKSPPKGRSPAKGQSPTKGQSSVKDHSPAKEPSPEKEPSSADKQTLEDEQLTATECSEDQGKKEEPEAKENSPIKEKSPSKSRSPARGQSPAKTKSPVKGQSQAKEFLPSETEPPSADEQPLKKEQSTATEGIEEHEPSTAEEQSEAKEKSPDIKSQESLTNTEDPPRLDTPTKRTKTSTPAKLIEVEEATTSSVARRSLRSDKPESKPGTPETTPIKQSSRKSRAKLPLKSELTFLKDDSSRRSSPRLGRSPAESHSSQECPKSAKEKSMTESKSPIEPIEPKETNLVEAINPVEDVPVTDTDSTILAEEKPISDETDANKVDVKSSKKKGKKRKSMAKPTEELPHTPKQSTSSESEQKDEPPEIQANETSELPAEQSKASESKADNSEAENIDEKPSSSRKSRSRRSRWDQLKPESDSHTESSEVEREKIQLRTSSRGSNTRAETKVDDSSGKKEKISTKVSREDKLKTDASETPAKPHFSRSRGTTNETSKNDMAEENESSRERSVKSKSETVSLGKKRRNKSQSQMQVDDSSDQTETEPEKRSTKANSKKTNPTSKSKAVLNSADPDPNSKETTQEKNDKEKSKNRKSKGTNEPKENIDTETAVDVVAMESVSLTAANSAEDLPKPSSKAETAEVKDKPVKGGRIKNRKHAVSVEDSENDQVDSTSQLADRPPTPKSDTILDTEPIPPPPTNKEPEKEAIVSRSQKKSKKKQRKSKATISASAKDSKDSVPIPTPAEPISEISETKPEEPSQTDAKTTRSNSPSKTKDNMPEEEKDSESKTKPKTPSTNLSCRKLRVLLKRTPTSNLMSIGKNADRKGTSNKRKKFNKLLQRIEEDAASELVDTQNKPNSESEPVCESDSVTEATCDVQKNVPKKAIDDFKEEVPKKTATVTDIQEKVDDEPVSENSTEHATATETPDEQKHMNETPNPSGDDKVSQEETTKKQAQEEEEIQKEEEAPEVESTEDIPKGQETREDRETDIEVDTPIDEETHKDQETPGEEGATKDLEPSEESLTEDCTDSDSLAPEIAPSEAPASPSTQDSTETETTGVTVVAPEDSTNSRVKRSMRKREADSSQPDDAIKLKQHLAMKSTLERKRQLLKNAARRRKLQAEQDNLALKRTKTDPARGKTISMIGNETIMTSPSVETRSEQPQTSQAAKRTAAASKGPNYAEITKHVIIPAPGKKPADAKPPGSLTKKPMVQTLLSSTLNLRKPLPEEESASTSGSRKSLGKVEVEASKAKSQATLNNSFVLTKKAVLPASKKNESPAKEDKSAAIALRKVNISVSLIPSKDNPANTSPNKSLETSPVLTRKVQLVEAQKTARKSEAKKKADPKVAEPETQPVSPLDKNKLKVGPKSAVAVDTSAKKIDSQVLSARKSLPVEVPKKTEARKSEGQSLNSRKAPPKADAPLKIETRKSEGAQLARKGILPKGSVAKELELQKQTVDKDAKSVESADTSATEEVVTANKAIAEQRKESSAALRIEKPTVAVTPRTVSLAKTMHLTRAASSSRSLAPTPTPVREEQQTSASTDRLSLPSTQSLPEPPRPLRKGRNVRVTPAVKRKAPGAAEAIDPKRAKAEQQLSQEDSDHESQSMAFPVKITAAGLDQHVDPQSTNSNSSLVSKKQAVKKTPVQEVKHRKLRIRVNRHVVTQWLKDQQAKKRVLPRKVPAPVDDVASDTESAAESMTESFNSSRPEPPVAVLVPPVPPLAPIKDLVPPVVTTEAPEAQTVLAEDSVTSAPVPPVSPPPDSVPPAPVPPAPVLPAPVLPAPVPPAPDSVPSSPPASVPATAAVKTPEKGPNEADAKRLAALRKVQMHTTLPMPLPVPITVPEVKSEPEDEPPQPMEEDSQEAQPLVAAPQPVPEAPLVAQGTPPVAASSRPVISVVSASTAADRPAPSDIPSASAPGNNANSFGNTKMFSFLYPNRHSGNYGEVGLDFCCPNLEGPMVAIDPTRLHAKVEAPVLEMPQFLVITTKFISKADKNIPNKVRAKLELLGKDKELSSIERPTTVPDPPALDTSASLVPIPQSLPLGPCPPSSTPLPATPLLEASSSTTTPTAPASSFDSLSKQLPRGTILTKKALPSGAPAPPTASDSVPPSPPLSLIQLPTLCPTDQQRTELQARVQVFDLVLQTLSRRVANLTVVERQRTIEEIVKTSTLMPIDVDVGTKLLENYVHYLNKATSSTPVPPLPSEATPIVPQIPPTGPASSTPALSQSIVSPATTTAAPQPDKIVIRKPIYDVKKNVIGFKSVTSPNVKAPASTSSRRSAPATTSTPLAASTSAAAAAASDDSRFVEVDSKTVKACQRQMLNLRAPAQKSAGKSSIIAIKPGSKAKTTIASVGKAASPAMQKPAASPHIRGPAASPAIRGPAGSPAIRGPAVSPASRCPAARGPASRTPATLRGPPPLKPATSPGAVRRVGSVPLAAPSLTRTSNPNVFIINQASHVEESILPDSNNVVAPMEAEIKGELDDSTEVII